jgi:pimeloyl-ACP methyl ester carboxylesterase
VIRRLLALAVLALAGGDAVAEPEATRHATCWFEVPAGRTATCWSLILPMDRADPGAGSVRLDAVVIGRHDADGTGDPVIYIPGGPGGSAGIESEAIGGWFERTRDLAWLTSRDLVLVAPRGVKPSEPSLACDEARDAVRRSVAKRGRLDERTLQSDAVLAAFDACLDRLAEEGLDLADFAIAERVADVIDVARLLGLSRWSLMGVSDGTRVALKVAERAPDGLAAMVLDSVLPPDIDLERSRAEPIKTEDLIHLCRRWPQCIGRLGNVDGWIASTARALGAAPLEVKVDLGTGSPARVALDGAGFRYTMTMLDQYSAARLAYLIAVELARQHDDDALAELVPGIVDLLATHVAAFPFLQVRACAEDRAREGARVDATSCIGPFDIDAIDRAWVEPAPSDVPALLLVGALDTITPPDFALHAAESLGHAHVMVVPQRGHGVLGDDGCLDNVVAAFLDDPSASPFHACLKGRGIVEGEGAEVASLSAGPSGKSER